MDRNEMHSTKSLPDWPRPRAWAMVAPNCDGSADWVELGAEKPRPMTGFDAVPLYDPVAIDEIVALRFKELSN